MGAAASLGSLLLPAVPVLAAPESQIESHDRLPLFAVRVRSVDSDQGGAVSPFASLDIIRGDTYTHKHRFADAGRLDEHVASLLRGIDYDYYVSVIEISGHQADRYVAVRPAVNEALADFEKWAEVIVDGTVKHGLVWRGHAPGIDRMYLERVLGAYGFGVE